MKLHRKIIAATAAGEQTSTGNPAQASYELSGQSPLGVGSLVAAMFVHHFMSCPVMLSTGSRENDGHCTF